MRLSCIDSHSEVLPYDIVSLDNGRGIARDLRETYGATPSALTGEKMKEWQDWQAIETAPRDGTEILLFARGQRNDDYRGVGQWSEQRKDWFWSFAIRPTHWMPLPEPPA
jgi:hypothetical protein